MENTTVANRRAIERELLDLERKYWRALKDQDTEVVVRLTDDGCIVSGAQGFARFSKQTMGEMMRQPGWTLEEFELIEGAQVQVLSDDVAVLAYRVREKLTVDGQPVTFEAADSSTWVRRNGDWQCVLHTESLIGDPFGRDRVRAADRSPRARPAPAH